MRDRFLFSFPFLWDVMRKGEREKEILRGIWTIASLSTRLKMVYIKLICLTTSSDSSIWGFVILIRSPVEHRL